MRSEKPAKVLVIGATGMLGSEMVGILQKKGREVVQAVWPPTDIHDTFPLDITDYDAVRVLIEKVEPVEVYNCSAFTDVDGAEENEELATAVNGKGVEYLAESCRYRNIFFAHVSTDYVFDGSGQSPYKPNGLTNPQSAYGRSKLAGEEAIKSVGGNWLIVRTSWLFGRMGSNFVDTILNLARKKPCLKVVNDQVGCPTYAPDLARCLADLAENNGRGIYHFCNQPACSWFDLAREAVEKAGLNCLIEPCDSSEFPRPAARPAYSVLDCSATFAQLGWTNRSWKEALAEYLSRR